MREMLERLLRSADVPNPERAESLWAEYRDGGSGANKAFATLLAWYGNAVYRRIWGFVRSDAAEDVFQDVLAKLHRERANLATFDHALRWLRTVAVTQSVDAHRRATRRKARDRRAARPEAEPPDDRPDELQEVIRVALAGLTDEQREAVALHYFEGLTKRDAATVLGIDRDTVAKRLQEALGRLRQLVPVPAVAAAGGVAGLEAKLAASVPLSPARMAALIAAAGCGSALAGWLASTKAKVLAAVLVVGVVSAVSGYVLTRSPDMPPKSPHSVRLGVEPLEARTVPAAGFLSALGVGNAEGSTSSTDLAIDPAGNRYVSGRFAGTTDFDPARTHPGDADILTARGSGDGFVAKYAPDDTLIWVRRMGGDDGDVIRSITLDGSGNVVVAGDMSGTGDFGPVTLTSSGRVDGFVAKLDAAGNVLWANRWGEAGSDEYGSGVGVDATGNVYALVARVSGQYARHILKFSPAGAQRWVRTVNTGSVVATAALAVSPAGDVFTVGTFRGTVDFDPGPRTKYATAGREYSGYALKLDTNGNFAWVSPFVGKVVDATTFGFSMGNSVALDGGGNVIVGGFYSGPVDFDPGSGTTTLPGRGGYVTKLTSNGALVWARAIEETNVASCHVRGLAVDGAGNVYATGTFSLGLSGNASIDLDPGPGTQTGRSNGLEDAFVLKLDSAGTYQWAETFGGPINESAWGVAVDPAGVVHLSGSYSGTVDFAPGADTHELTAPGNNKSSFYLVKWSQN